jgi:1-phosphofructokinase family hexose kinase
VRLLCLAPTPSLDRFIEVDRVAPGLIHRPSSVTVVPGGKGLNLARSAAALGADVTVVGILSGNSGRWIAETLTTYGVHGDFVWSEGETRSCLSIYERERGVLTEFYEPAGLIGSDDWERFRLLVRGHSAHSSVVAASGSLPPGAPVDGYAQISSLLNDQGVRFLLDTHGKPLKEALRTQPWLVKVNRDEAIEIVGSGDGASLARALVEQGAGSAVVTLGAEGAAVSSREGDWLVDPVQMPGKYPVGSGDAFLAGMAVRVLAGGSLPDAARDGAAAAAANAVQPGPGILHRDDVERFHRETNVRRCAAAKLTG